MHVHVSNSPFTADVVEEIRAVASSSFFCCYILRKAAPCTRRHRVRSTYFLAWYWCSSLAHCSWHFVHARSLFVRPQMLFSCGATGRVPGSLPQHAPWTENQVSCLRKKRKCVLCYLRDVECGILVFGISVAVVLLSIVLKPLRRGKEKEENMSTYTYIYECDGLVDMSIRQTCWQQVCRSVSQLGAVSSFGEGSLPCIFQLLVSPYSQYKQSYSLLSWRLTAAAALYK